jgi:hypothetical protein
MADDTRHSSTENADGHHFMAKTPFFHAGMVFIHFIDSAEINRSHSAASMCYATRTMSLTTVKPIICLPHLLLSPIAIPRP